MDTQKFECRIHLLEFEYPLDWVEMGLPPGECPMCLQKKLSDLQKEHNDACKHLDTLFNAIELKINRDAGNE